MKKRTKGTHLQDTGERMVPEYHKAHMIYGEHITRYRAAASIVADKIVLDIASGSGYGSALLAKTAKQVFGVDLDEQAIRYAQSTYGSPNTTFLQGDGTKIPLESNSVDIVISFETIEHIKDYRAFLAEVRRVLRDDGLFVLSTPNDIEFAEGNHFHIHEFEREELESLVGAYFKNMVAYYEGTWLYSALFSEQLLGTEWEAPLQTLQAAPIDKDKSTYFYLLCANRPIHEVIEPLGTISEHYSERDRQTLERSMRKHMDDQGAIMENLKARLDARELELSGVYASKRWQLMKKISALRPRVGK